MIPFPSTGHHPPQDHSNSLASIRVISPTSQALHEQCAPIHYYSLSQAVMYSTLYIKLYMIQKWQLMATESDDKRNWKNVGFYTESQLECTSFSTFTFDSLSSRTIVLRLTVSTLDERPAALRWASRIQMILYAIPAMGVNIAAVINNGNGAPELLINMAQTKAMLAIK